VNNHSYRFDAVRHSSSQGEAAVVAAWNHLQNLGGWDLLELYDVPEGGTISALVSAAHNSGVRTAQVPMYRSPYVPIPSDPAGLQQLPANKRLRRQLRSIHKELAEAGQFQLQRVGEADQAVLERFYELESAGWKGSEGSAIKCDPKLRQFYDEVGQAAGRFGYLCMDSLELNGELLASQFGFSHRGRYFSLKIATSEKFPQYAPGHLIVDEILQDCASRDISEYDFLGADAEWKARWTSESRPHFKYFVFHRAVPGGLAHTLRFRLRPLVKKLIRR
jgi:CelD/BcsL family acetyltransferase involved in cellulose biosynthesis